MKRLLFLVNIHAGKGGTNARYIDAVDIFVRNGYEVVIHTPQHPGQLTQLVASRGGEFDVVVACGGDGTLNEVVNGLMRLDRRPMLGYIPSGTTNDFARQIGMPVNNFAEAARIIMAGEPVPIDIGSFNDRYFTYVAAFGAFSHISYETSQSAKNMLGKAAYLMEGVKSLTSIHPITTRFNYRGEEKEQDFVLGIFSNSSVVAGFRFKNLSDASITDGMLETTLIKMPEGFRENSLLMNSVLRLDFEDNAMSIFSFKTDRITVRFNNPVAFTLDGEYAGAHLSADIRIIPNVLSVLLDKKSEEL